MLWRGYSGAVSNCALVRRMQRFIRVNRLGA